MNVKGVLTDQPADDTLNCCAQTSGLWTEAIGRPEGLPLDNVVAEAHYRTLYCPYVFAHCKVEGFSLAKPALRCRADRGPPAGGGTLLRPLQGEVLYAIGKTNRASGRRRSCSAPRYTIAKTLTSFYYRA
ncbi:hypothetical protein ES703_84039 [subsurface metagenome]